MSKAILVLEDGLIFEGRAVGAQGEATGELVFNTSMMGYQEILTDPSYAGQIITMTYPQIGNYGCNEEDVESRQPFCRGFVMRECCFEPSNFRATSTLPEYLEANNIVGIDGVDTRKITKHLREKGAMKCVISTTDFDHDSLIAKAKAGQDMAGSDYVKEVTTNKAYEWNPESEGRFRVVAIDYGIKYNILRELDKVGCKVIVLPATATLEDIEAYSPDGVFLSNGPGDPAALEYLYPTIQGLVEKQVPIFGICLGHQVLSHALGGTTYKLKFGHRGGNQPVIDDETSKVEITSQNHGFAVDAESFSDSDIEISHTNLNDKSVEGLSHKLSPLFSVQHHPEASPGPHDSAYLFERFTEMMDVAKA
jgi:carbamoyl-phosphate synthase small subunit